MSCSTLGPLWLDRLSMTTMSPFESVRNETFFHPLLKGRRIHRLIESLLGHEAGKAQAGDQRDGLVVAVGNADA